MVYTVTYKHQCNGTLIFKFSSSQNRAIVLKHANEKLESVALIPKEWKLGEIEVQPLLSGKSISSKI